VPDAPEIHDPLSQVHAVVPDVMADGVNEILEWVGSDILRAHMADAEPAVLARLKADGLILDLPGDEAPLLEAEHGRGGETIEDVGVALREGDHVLIGNPADLPRRAVHVYVHVIRVKAGPVLARVLAPQEGDQAVAHIAAKDIEKPAHLLRGLEGVELGQVLREELRRHVREDAVVSLRPVLAAVTAHVDAADPTVALGVELRLEEREK